jgi:uncharacterized protein YndB with AHSA1/START domain
MIDERLGTITPCYTMTFRRHTPHPAARLWAAITDASEIAAWMGYPTEVDLRVGGRWYVDFSRTEGGDLPGVIIRVEIERVLSYVWGWSVIEWTLAPVEDGCEYTFVHAGQHDRGEDEEGLAAGWHSFLDQLGRHLEGAVLDAHEEHANWLRLKPAYREQLDRVLPGRSP